MRFDRSTNGVGKAARATRGFTLVELLVVVVIITILISAVLVASSTLIAKAKSSATLAVLTVVQAYNDFATSHDARRPVGYTMRFPDQTRLGFATDLGQASSETVAALSGCELLALEANRRIGARPHLARTQYEYAQRLLGAENTSHADLARARELLAQAEATARELGMHPLLERVQRIGTQGRPSKK